MKINSIVKKKPFLIAGPCSAESEKQLFQIAKQITSYTDVFRAGIWKPRTNPNSFSGVGEKGLVWLQNISKEFNIKTSTEVATAKHVEKCLKHDINILWIGARTTVNPFYMQEIAEALKGVDIPVCVKNPIHPELGLWIGALERLYKSGIRKLIAIHRGFFTYQDSAFRNDPKWEIPIKLKELVQDIPIICDPSHISGNASIIKDICQTAMDLNMDGFMIETHQSPKNALTDSYQQITPKKLQSILTTLIFRNPKLENEKISSQLRNIRGKIDSIDSEIVELLKNRKEIVEMIAEFKRNNQLTIFQIERWYEILKNRKSDSKKLKLNEKMLIEIFEVIHKYSILTQTKLMRNEIKKQ